MEAHYFVILANQPKSVWISLVQHQKDSPAGRAAAQHLEYYYQTNRQAFRDYGAGMSQKTQK